jgi:hypothetical protein
VWLLCVYCSSDGARHGCLPPAHSPKPWVRLSGHGHKAARQRLCSSGEGTSHTCSGTIQCLTSCRLHMYIWGRTRPAGNAACHSLHVVHATQRMGVAATQLTISQAPPCMVCSAATLLQGITLLLTAGHLVTRMPAGMRVGVSRRPATAAHIAYPGSGSGCCWHQHCCSVLGKHSMGVCCAAPTPPLDSSWEYASCCWAQNELCHGTDNMQLCQAGPCMLPTTASCVCCKQGTEGVDVFSPPCSSCAALEAEPKPAAHAKHC